MIVQIPEKNFYTHKNNNTDYPIKFGTMMLIIFHLTELLKPSKNKASINLLTFKVNVS